MAVFKKKKPRAQRKADLKLAREARQARKIALAEKEEAREEKNRLREKKQKRAKRRSSGLKQVIMVLILCLLVGTAVVSMFRLVRLQGEVHRMETELSDLTQQRDSLQEELQHVSDPEYVEQQARDQLHMIKDGEVLYIIQNQQPAEEGGEPEAGEETP